MHFIVSSASLQYMNPPEDSCNGTRILTKIRSFQRKQTGWSRYMFDVYCMYATSFTIRRLNRALGFVVVSGIILATCRLYNPFATPAPKPPAIMSTTAALKHLKVAPKEAHKATVIFLHVGHFHHYLIVVADRGRALVITVRSFAPLRRVKAHQIGAGWLPVAKMLWASFPHVKWILPHAPEIPITLNGGQYSSLCVHIELIIQVCECQAGSTYPPSTILPIRNTMMSKAC
jgi:hypothetical protein